MFKKIFYIHHPVRFQGDQEHKSKEQIKTLLNNDSKINIVNFDFV